MKRTVVVMALIAASASAVGLTKENPLRPAPGMQDLLLNGAGVRTPGPGQIRIPVPVDGVAYEVIGARPGEPKVFPAR